MLDKTDAAYETWFATDKTREGVWATRKSLVCYLAWTNILLFLNLAVLTTALFRGWG